MNDTLQDEIQAVRRIMGYDFHVKTCKTCVKLWTVQRKIENY